MEITSIYNGIQQFKSSAYQHDSENALSNHKEGLYKERAISDVSTRYMHSHSFIEFKVIGVSMTLFFLDDVFYDQFVITGDINLIHPNENPKFILDTYNKIYSDYKDGVHTYMLWDKDKTMTKDDLEDTTILYLENTTGGMMPFHQYDNAKSGFYSKGALSSYIAPTNSSQSVFDGLMEQILQ